LQEKIDAQRREFLANVSHELKTPIALIQGYAEGLRENILDDQKSREEYAGVIVDEAAKMNHMVKQITALNQLEFGENAPDMEEFDLSELISGMLERMKKLFSKNEALIEFRPDGPVPVIGDAFQIEEVISNYLTNALNHLDGDRTIEISFHVQDDVVETSVFNSGKPIPEEELEKIWVKFYKIDKARTRAYGGSGIGLSIVKAIMDAHGQTCRAVNYKDGVAFCFTLSLAKHSPEKNIN
ncbi:MAG: two-component sensor histidine kinase, partial [Eubacterium sp.]|nr:two-component sensor histidine kinase [Eubacterium sp.]